jgi:hypothetical protein
MIQSFTRSFINGSAALSWAIVSSSIIFFSQTVRFLTRMVSPSKGRYLHTGQHKHRIKTHTQAFMPLSGIRTHDPSSRAIEDSSCLRHRSHRDRQCKGILHKITIWTLSMFFYGKKNVSETGLCLRPQVTTYSAGFIHRVSPYLRSPTQDIHR